MKRLGLLLLGGLLLGSAASAQPAQQRRFAVSRVQAVGGNAVEGVEQGILLDLGSSACRTPAPRLAPCSGPLGAEVRLLLTVVSCPPGGPAPAVGCEVQVEGQKPVSARFSGGQGEAAVPMPPKTGIYRTEIRCTADGEESEALTTTLYVTYAKPRPAVDPPEEDWYRQACSWGAGLTRADSETKAVETLTRSIYGYGQRRWRYGYCSFQGKRCAFGKTSLPRTSPDLDCFDEYQVCRCTWEAMVRPGGPCNFSDCTGLAEVLHYMSATLGISGLEPYTARGLDKQGFLTPGSARAFDPASMGNFLCGYRDLPCAFVFNLHSLVKRDGLYFDPTFGKVYQDLGKELYADNVECWPGNDVALKVQWGAFAGDGYGSFDSFRERQAPIGACPPEAAGEARRSGRRRLITTVEPREPPARLSVPDFGRDSEELLVSIEAKEAGSYILDARLACGTETLGYAGARADLVEGAQVVGLRFEDGALARRKAGEACLVTVELHRSRPREPAGTVTVDVSLPR